MKLDSQQYEDAMEKPNTTQELRDALKKFSPPFEYDCDTARILDSNLYPRTVVKFLSVWDDSDDVGKYLAACLNKAVATGEPK